MQAFPSQAIKSPAKKLKPNQYWAAIEKNIKRMVKGVRSTKSSRQPLTGRKKQIADYRRKAKAFVAEKQRAGVYCEVMYWLAGIRTPVTEVHHRYGRAGSLLLDERFWTALSAAGHRWVHQNMDEARKYGWIAPKNAWNRPPKNN